MGDYEAWEVEVTSADGEATYTRSAEVGRIHHITYISVRLAEPPPVRGFKVPLRTTWEDSRGVHKAHIPETDRTMFSGYTAASGVKQWGENLVSVPGLANSDNGPPNTGLYVAPAGSAITVTAEALASGPNYVLTLKGWTADG